MTLTKQEVLAELFVRGGSVDRQTYSSYSREATLTYVRFDTKHDVWGRYVVFEEDKFICTGFARSGIERKLGICNG